MGRARVPQSHHGLGTGPVFRDYLRGYSRKGERQRVLRTQPITRGVNDDRRFELLVQAVTDYAIYMLDPTGHIVSWNKGAARIKGYRSDEIIGQHSSAFFTEEDRAAGRPALALASALRTGRFEDEAWRVRK